MDGDLLRGKLKVHRLREIENILGFQQHRRFEVHGVTTDKMYQLFGMRGHDIDLYIYVVTSLGAILIGVANLGMNLWLFSPVLVTGFVLVCASIIDRRFKEHLDSLWAVR